MNSKSLWGNVCRAALAPRSIFVAGLFAASAGSTALGQLVELVSPNAEAAGKFGTSVAGACDFTGDGRGDMIVGAPDENGGQAGSGRVYLYNGWTGAVVRTLVSPNPESSGAFGTAVAGVNDVTGDGLAEIAVGARSEDGGTIANSGRVYLFSGADGSLLQTISSPNAVINGNFGSAIGGVPDANGDFKGDLVVGAPDETNGSVTHAGRAYIFNGAGGASGAMLFQLDTPHATSFSGFGSAVAGSPDFSGDGKGDVIVGAQCEPGGGAVRGQAYAFNGATGALIREIASPLAEENGFFGASVAGTPDVTGDGFGDYMVGAFNQTSGAVAGAGRAYLFNGSTGAFVQAFDSANPESGGSFGTSVAVAWAVEHAGVSTVVVGATGEDAGASNSGRVYRMSLAGALVETINSPHALVNGRFGSVLADVPESTRDGVDEFAYGAPAESAGSGRAYLRLLGPLGFTPTPTPDGSPTISLTPSPSFTPSESPTPSPSFTPSFTDSPSPTQSPSVTLTPSLTPSATALPLNQRELKSPAEQETTYFGTAIGGVPDADGDGRGDVIVGTIFQMRAYLFSGATGSHLFTFAPPNQNLHSGNYGQAVAGVPDVDGDGRGDVIVGSAQEDDPVGVPTGRVFVYSGATGALLQALIAPTVADTFFGSFGGSVAGIRDIDNDGRGDILVGAYGFANGFSGHAFAYSGATGKLLFELHPGTLATRLFGYWIASCPDIDLDGRDEILVTQLSSNEGNVNVFSGADGHWMRAVGIGMEYGNGVAGLPDVTGDGRGDIAAGDANIERVLIFNGFTGELVHTIDAPDPAITNLFTSSFGGSIAGVRDLNGDGRGEILIGSPADHYIQGAIPTSIGRVYVYDGRTGTELFHLESPIPEIDSQQGNAFGQRVAVIPGTSAPGMAGLIVGAPNSSPVPSPFNAGRVHIFDVPLPDSARTLNQLLGIASDPGPDANTDGAVDIADLLLLLLGS